MLTYQDLLAVGENDYERSEFVRKVIQAHTTSDLYRIARIGDDYARCQNTTIMNYQNVITLVTGEQVPDRFSPVHRSATNFFKVFVTQLSQYLLANGVTWNNDGTGQRLGEDFDSRLQELAKSAMRGGVAFGFWNLDHLEVFSVYDKKKGCFAPLYDEENGGLAAGVRSWQIDSGKPLRATLYEIDGLTEYLWDKDNVPVGSWIALGQGAYMQPKRPYVLRTRTTEVDGTEIYAEENYPAFPIIPLWANPEQQSEIVGLREKIDAYDMILNGFENDLDNAQLYWIIKGAGGMDDKDLSRFLDRLRVVKAAAPADGQEVDPVAVNIPYEAREKLLDRVEQQLYKDAMIMNPQSLASSAATATQIMAAYTPQNNKADELEYCILDFIHALLAVAGLPDETPTFTRSMIVNAQEEVQTVVAAATYLDREYVTTKVLTILGDGDKADEVLRRMDAEEQERLVDEEEDEDTASGPRDGTGNASGTQGGLE